MRHIKVSHWQLAGIVAVLLLVCSSFPALYGDEYGSLADADNFARNLHAVGYFVQLHFWKKLYGGDVFLRLLSLLWMAAGLHWLDRWLLAERLPDNTRRLVLLLAATNPFLWFYFVQVRFYSFFFAASVLAMWRLRAWQSQPSRKNAWLVVASSVLVGTAHLFGWLVVGIVALSWLWPRLRNRGWLAAAGAVGCLLLLMPAVRQFSVALVHRLTFPPGDTEISSAAVRGLSPAMLAKVPLTFYFFALGERVYPLWWWITLPAGAIIATAFFFGLQSIRRYSGLNVLVTLTLLSIAVVYLVFDPLAPPFLQRAAPRYAIYAAPAFLLTVGCGSVRSRSLAAGVILVQLLGLTCLLRPGWSYGGTDLMDWRRYLKDAAPVPAQTCFVVDGRASDPVKRYAPSGSRISRSGVENCLSSSRIAAVSNDDRLLMTRELDDLTGALENAYDLVSNVTVFPAQISVYELSAGGLTALPPARLGLPEQDLRLPLEVDPEGWKIPGFVRLDSGRREVRLAARLLVDGPVWVASNYRADHPLPIGAPVAAVLVENPAGQPDEIILRAGVQTAAWDGRCDNCRALAGWKKRAHLLGSTYYPGAYRQYQATIWGTVFRRMHSPVTGVRVRSLLSEGTFYFWGFYPAGAGKWPTGGASTGHLRQWFAGGGTGPG